MKPRTFVIGDIHGDLEHLGRLLKRLPKTLETDTIVFLGDYLDRGADSAGVVEVVREILPKHHPGKLVALRGNHEDAWLKVIDGTKPEFVFSPGNGCNQCMDSFYKHRNEELPSLKERYKILTSGSFFPDEIVDWMKALPVWYEDKHAIYVHAGLPKVDGEWLHPSKVEDPRPLLWQRSTDFAMNYDGKLVVCGHTLTNTLPDVSVFTPDDPDDLWARDSVIDLDTGCGKGGFLTCLQLPHGLVYESR